MGVSSDLKSRYKLCLCTMLTYIVKQHALWELSHFFLTRETQLSVRLWLVYCVRCVSGGEHLHLHGFSSETSPAVQRCVCF